MVLESHRRQQLRPRRFYFRGFVEHDSDDSWGFTPESKRAGKGTIDDAGVEKQDATRRRFKQL